MGSKSLTLFQPHKLLILSSGEKSLSISGSARHTPKPDYLEYVLSAQFLLLFRHLHRVPTIDYF